MKFEELKWEKHSIAIEWEEAEKKGIKMPESLFDYKDSKRAVAEFDNGYKLSIIKGEIFYTSPGRPYEAMIISTGDIDLANDPLTSEPNEPYGHLTAEDVQDLMDKLEAL